MGYSLYVHINKINQKRYFGITQAVPEKRWGYNGYGYVDQVFYRAIKLYGWDGFDHLVLMQGLSKSQAEEQERKHIREFQTTNHKHGYNVAAGGAINECNPWIGRRHSAESKQKISKAMSGKRFTEEHKKHMSQSRLGSSHPNNRAVICIDTGITYNTMSDASNITGAARQTIWAVCNGKRQQSGGYRWAYAPKTIS